MTLDLSAQIPLLRGTPQTLRALLAGVPRAWCVANEGPGTWSPFDVVGHLVHGERTNWIPRARLILEHGPAAPFPPFDRTAQFRESEGKSLDELLEELERLRADNLATLASWQLDERLLSREGMHPEFGRVTLRQLLATWVVHDLSHLAQIARVLARQNGEEVGPWREYLPVLRR